MFMRRILHIFTLKRRIILKNIMFVVTTSTFANTAKEKLMKHKITATVKKAQGGTAAGCLFGVSVAKTDFKTAEKILLENGIRIIAVRDD